MNIPRSQSMPQRAKHDEYSSFSKREKGIPLYIYSPFRSPIIQSAKHGIYSSFSKHENPATQQRCIFPRAPNTVNMLRSQSVISRALHRAPNHSQSMPQRAKHDEYSSFSKREKGIALYIYSPFRSPIIQSAKHGIYSSFSKHENPATQQRCIFPRAPNTVNMLRSQSVISRALHTVYSTAQR